MILPQAFPAPLFGSVLDIPYCVFSTRFELGYTGMSVIEFLVEDDGLCIPRALMVSADGHLYRDGLPTNYQNRVRF